MAPDQVVYRRYAPPPSAHGIVEHLWVVRVPAGHVEREVLLPDGHGLVTVAVGAAGVHIDPLTLARTTDGSGVRGLADRAFVREQRGPSVRLGAQLDPVALARMGVRAGAHEPVAVSEVLGADVEEACAAALDQGRDADAAAILGEDLAAHAVPAPVGSPLEALAPVLRGVVEQRGLVRASDLARRADLAVGVLHREVVETLGITPEAFLAAVRFSAFVRDAVGPGPVRPQDTLAVLQWYLRAGYPPREVERFTGLGHVELRRLEAGHRGGARGRRLTLGFLLVSERIRVAVLGAAGRMGQTVVRAVQGAPDLELVAAVDADADLVGGRRRRRAGRGRLHRPVRHRGQRARARRRGGPPGRRHHRLGRRLVGPRP